MNLPWLSCVLWFPFVGACICVLLPRGSDRWAAYITLVCLLIELLVIALLFYQLPATKGIYAESNFLWVERHTWFSLNLGDSLGQLRVDYLLGVDGLNGPLLLLAVCIFLIGLFTSWGVKKQRKYFFALYLLLFGCVVGTLCSLDMLLFLLFIELLTLPAYLLIAVWGGNKRLQAALHFLIYSFAGSVLLLFVLLGLYLSVALPLSLPAPTWGEEAVVHHLDLMWLMDPTHYSALGLLSPEGAHVLLGIPLRTWAFFLLFIGFAIKLPIVPLHTWLPQAHVEAPTGISIVLAGVVLKLGGYGLLRIGFGVFADQMLIYGPVVATLGVISILYAGFNALKQQDMKCLIAYSSIAHMGFVVLGMGSLTEQGLFGAVYQMVSHGFITAALFMLVDCLAQRCGSRRIEDISGLATKLPIGAMFFIIFAFASFGMPGFSSFVAEALIVTGSMQAALAGNLSWMLSVLTLGGIVLTAGYFIWTYQRVFQGPYWLRITPSPPFVGPIELHKGEQAVLYSVLLVVLLLGLYPQLLLQAMQATMSHLTQLLYAYTAT